MVGRAEIARIASGYGGARIGVLGSHSALEVMDGAKDEGLETVVFCQRGREEPYRRFGRIADEVVVLDRFSDMASPGIQRMMRETETLIVPHRSLTAYLGYGAVEGLRVPIFGNRGMFRAEERTARRGQYYLLRRAGIRHPRILKPGSIDGPCIVKVQERGRPLERAFFVATSAKDYREKCAERIRAGLVSERGVREAVVEELVIGTYMNFNFFHTPISDQVDFLGIERRLQTNIHDYVSMPARQQLEADVELQNIEVGHTPASIRESLLEKVISMGDRFVEAAAGAYPPGVVGPFSLQGVITRDLEIVIYDVSLRVPGNPILATTSPYTKYQYGETFGVGRRIAMEVRRALREDRLAEVVT
ncbi:5-formaminoimidazole-4-carboxamide-1-(beta)-D-ribofuranosyl 5'-monophosphate synthetase [Nitrosopumilaceae archaeon]|nr:formate--phosphoribosylaminoimidazolecarboxamide ligase family protein [Nitrosopumilus sp.]CAI9831860.1 5-formaminoimidazole-4-carboxamide-1-(beta)-D-ribofuranosyl 5'-monophosphate synthetase [Nitrosopumilaceae archaeon]MDA7945151.1 formate--phosphoribosylaminoimidazolecarboxamide ligase family protein [Nitrosopumilus sp.]MDA7955163.1 formate--phosphoribosylaminoimidazolecarboxamide ligase family protein [Nitrosopumilus sp.]MDA7973764.1 formate--phosphoribosylaminoimidazolecarboxamide ligase